MIDRLREFVALLRKNGVRTSTAELLDAARALEVVGLDDPLAVRGARAVALDARMRWARA